MGGKFFSEAPGSSRVQASVRPLEALEYAQRAPILRQQKEAGAIQLATEAENLAQRSASSVDPYVTQALVEETGLKPEELHLVAPLFAQTFRAGETHREALRANTRESVVRGRPQVYAATPEDRMVLKLQARQETSVAKDRALAETEAALAAVPQEWRAEARAHVAASGPRLIVPGIPTQLTKEYVASKRAGVEAATMAAKAPHEISQAKSQAGYAAAQQTIAEHQVQRQGVQDAIQDAEKSLKDAQLAESQLRAKEQRMKLGTEAIPAGTPMALEMEKTKLETEAARMNIKVHEANLKDLMRRADQAATTKILADQYAKAGTESERRNLLIMMIATNTDRAATDLINLSIRDLQQQEAHTRAITQYMTNLHDSFEDTSTEGIAYSRNIARIMNESEMTIASAHGLKTVPVWSIVEPTGWVPGFKTKSALGHTTVPIETAEAYHKGELLNRAQGGDVQALAQDAAIRLSPFDGDPETMKLVMNRVYQAIPVEIRIQALDMLLRTSGQKPAAAPTVNAPLVRPRPSIKTPVFDVKPEIQYREPTSLEAPLP